MGGGPWPHMRAFTGSVNWISPVRGSFRRAAARRIERYSVGATMLGQEGGEWPEGLTPPPQAAPL